MNFIIGRKYEVAHLIGRGKFGRVYKGKNIKTRECVAIKVEAEDTPFKLLKHEASLLKYLYDHECRSIPFIYWYGVVDAGPCLVMPFYDCSLYDKAISYNNENLALEKIDQIMVICLDILESIHKNYVIHRDIKPHNFMYKNGELYLIDFGLSSFYIGENKEHVPILTDNEYITGTPKFISYYIHEGITPSRKDDLISLGYMYLWLLGKELPWDNVIGTDIETYEECHILHGKNQERKRLKSLENLSQIYGNVNRRVCDYLAYIYGLDYKYTPNYSALCDLFSVPTISVPTISVQP
jgi:casein kinase 1